MKRIADIITAFRIIFAVGILFFPPFSVAFYALYIAGGLSDMADGITARCTGSASEFGARLDTVADFAFFAACAVRLLPVIALPWWIWCWTGAVAAIKLASAVRSLVRCKKLAAVHSFMNKAAGLLLFLLPLSVNFIRPEYSAAAVCAAATAAAVQEWFIIAKKGSSRKVEG